MSTATGYAQKVIEALYENGDPVSIDAAELLERLTENVEPDAEPVAWMHPNGGVIQTRLTGLDRDTYTIPLYTRPEPARKPMTEMEIAKGFLPEPTTGMKRFRAGVRFAEKHHGIGGDK